MPARHSVGLAEDMRYSRTFQTTAPLQAARIVHRTPSAAPGLTVPGGGIANFSFQNSLLCDYAPATAGTIPLGVTYYEMNAAELAATVVTCGCMAVELDPAANFTQIGQLVYSSGVAGLATNVKGANTFYAGVSESLVHVSTKTPFPEGVRGLFPTEGQFYTPWPLSGPGDVRGGPDQFFILTAAQAANLGGAGVPTTGGVYNFLTNFVTTAPNGIPTAAEVAAQLTTPAGLVRFIGASPIPGTLRYVLMEICPGLAP